jgi:hypothetical protein
MLMLDGICKIKLYNALVCGNVLIFASTKLSLAKRFRWSWVCVLAFGSQGRGFKPRPKPSDFFKGKKSDNVVATQCVAFIMNKTRTT